ncbi:disease resistance protein RGA2-like [Zingiber officinale]|uniref:disease resistance protein RGA2-like n=1 Tax=Zingiber officinale TaxID=94328 RepID=UPI001C4B385C|nr:disease resistance protein RGA2-like [Zingiber officinale]
MKDDYEYRLIYLKSLAIAAAMDIVSPILEISGVNHVINKLVDKTTNYLQDQCYWETYLQEELKSLQDLLPQIEAVVSFAEHRLTSYESSDRALIKWLWKFRDVIDEAEDVLDELEYFELKKKANSDKNRLSRRVDASVKAAKRLLKFDDVLARLRTCVKNLNTSASDVGKFLALVAPTGGADIGQTQQGILPLSQQSRITSSLPVLSFKGREKEKQIIIQFLLGEEAEIQISENVHCLPLVGMGGMGKTSLAQQVFDHFKTVKKEHFDIKIWVCDSLPDLNASNLIKKILEYLTGGSESGPLELIPEKLKEKLHSKRFLLILDDVWDDKNQREWEKLCAPLLYGQKGSWVLLTTRSKSVANMVAREIRGTMMPMMLQGLSEDECRSLLYEYAFAGQDPNGFPLLKEIGTEILKKLKGVPLLAKSIGGALNSKLEVDHWTSILRSELWKRPQDSTYNFIPALTLSYVMHPPRLKRCFAYCSIFPQDYKFNKQKLVCMWVAAGLIYSDGLEEGSNEEDIANCCFDMLCNKSFFDVHHFYQSPFFYNKVPYALEEDYYTMHDMLNCLACHISQYECCRIVDGTTPSLILDNNTIRHIYITCSNAQLHDLANIVSKLKHLRTLWIEYDGDRQQFEDFIRDACKSPRRIRVLIMDSNLSDRCLKSISNFVKIRFLQIQNKFLPSISMRKFYFLQVLMGEVNILAKDVKDVKDANKLTNLRHLYKVHEDALLSVAKVGKLTSLLELCFTVGTKPRYRIDELMNMDNLRQLKIKQLSNVRSLEEANMVNLVKKRYLIRLELDWNDASNPVDDASNPELDQPVLAALQPYSTIRELTIRGYKGGRAAPWMDTPSLSLLENLQLNDCTSLEELPSLWKLPCLKFLELNKMNAIRSLGCHFFGQIDIQFPVLEEL